jgi:spermidine synthase
MTFLLCLIFFLSGSSALVFETLWFHQASLAFGNSIWASSLVLTAFMAGVALGNALAARYGERLGNPVRVYAGLEIAIAGSGLALVVALPHLDPLLTPLLRPFLDVPALLNPLRLSLAFPLLLVPSTAMGATLPLLVRALSASDPHFGSVLGRLYGWNTLGAVAGALAGEAALLAWLGVRGSGAAAAGLNVLAAALALWASTRVPSGLGQASRTAARPRANARALRLLAAAFLSGLALLALEVLWFRFLVLFTAPSSLAFAIMLAVVLAGIALGGLFAGACLRVAPAATRLLTPLAWASGASVVLVYWLHPLALERADPDYLGSWPQILGLGISLMLPVSFLSGVFFTGTGAALQRELAREARAVGLLTLANTLGAALGSLLAGFALLPTLGMERSFFVLAALYGLVGLVVPGSLLRAASPRTPRWLAAGLLAALLALFPFGLMESRFLPRSVERMAQGTFRVVAVREGLTETIQYARMDYLGEPYFYRLITNGYSMAGTAPMAQRYMRLFVYWPLAIHPDPRSALLISYGVGTTAKALTDSRGLESIDVVDTSRDVLEMSAIVHPPGRSPLDDPRVRVHVEDGRYFLQTTSRRFDLITGEPPPPKVAGVVNLYTREYFELIHERLSEGGIVTYWLPIGGLAVSETKAIVRAFCDAFADCSLWQGTTKNWMLVGTRGVRGPVPEERFVRQWHDPQVAPALRDVGLETPEQLGALFIGDAAQLEALTAGAPPLVDDWPKRLSAPVAGSPSLTSYSDWMDPRRTRERFRSSAYVQQLWPPGLREATLAAFDYQRLINETAMVPVRRAGEPVLEKLDRVLGETRLETLVLWLLGSDPVRRRIAERAAVRGDRDPRVLYERTASALARRDLEEAEEILAAVLADGRFAHRAPLRVYLLCRLGRTAEARELLRRLRAPRDAAVRAELRWLDATCSELAESDG